MPPIILPFTPAIGNALLWGAGALGTGLATLGIIDNKDEIANSTLLIIDRINNGVQTGIRRVSTAMSPTYVTPSVHYEQNVMGQPMKYVAISDAVSEPYQPINIGPISIGIRHKPEAAPSDSAGVVPRVVPDSAGVAPRVQPDSARVTARPDTARVAPQPRVVPPQLPSQEPDKKPDKKPDEDPNKKSNFKRILWETKDNNFGNNWYKWRNAGRVVFVYPPVAGTMVDLGMSGASGLPFQWKSGKLGSAPYSGIVNIGKGIYNGLYGWYYPDLTSEGYPKSHIETDASVEQPVQESDVTKADTLVMTNKLYPIKIRYVQ